MAFRISVDTGGTFSDVIVANEGGIISVEKALTTPHRIFDGMKSALEISAGRLGMELADLLRQTDVLIYGTTRAANAIVEGTVAKTAMLLTGGFPDILVFREGGKYRPHDFGVDYPQPYIPRRFTYEITERVSSEGEVLTPLDRTQAMGVLDRIEGRNFEAIAVCLLWSIVNPANELAMASLIEDRLPNVPYTLSHQLIPIIREYRRASATAIDASLKPLMQRHLREMEEDLRRNGYGGDILVSTSIGGSMQVNELAERPIHTVKSGPAMAPVAGRYYAQREQLGADVIVCDAGGTTFDVGLIRDGEPVYTRDSWLGPKWTGHIMSMSTIDVRSIGAGGGSIAGVDSGGLLRVGPRSAGSEPGPACYGKGGSEPTVTDAALILGYLSPTYFLGGRMILDAKAARAALQPVADRLKLSVQSAAFAVINLANEHMITAIREMTINEGINPKESAIVAGGGAGGLSIGLIARELGCQQVLIPNTAGGLSACGMQFSDIIFEQSASGLTVTNNFDFERSNAALATIAEALESFVAARREKGLGEHLINYFVEARYLHQIWELQVSLPFSRFRDGSDLERLIDAFHQTHERIFAVVDHGSPIECISWIGRVAIRLGNRGGLGPTAACVPTSAEPHEVRPAFFGGGALVPTPVHLGQDLVSGAAIPGPAIIQEETTTIVVFPGMTAEVTGDRSFLLHTRAPTRRQEGTAPVSALAG